MTDNQTPQQDENHLIAERRGKLAAIRKRGVAFPNDFVPADRAEPLHQRYGEQDQATLAAAAHPASVAGRMMLKRVMGKASFATLQDSTGRIQIYLDRTHHCHHRSSLQNQ
jgi:lysyl-tRNA synthetase, class II